MNKEIINIKDINSTENIKSKEKNSQNENDKFKYDTKLKQDQIKLLNS